MSFPSLSLSARPAHRLADREYLVVTCESDAAAIRAALPRPLEPDGSNVVRLRFVATRAPSGAGSFLETDLVIPALFDGAAVDFTAQRHADDELPALADRANRCAWPRRPGRTRLLFTRESAAAVLEIGGRAAVLAEMGHGKHGVLAHETIACPAAAVRRLLAPTQVGLKRVCAAGGRAAIAQLVGTAVGNVRVKSAWAGPARLHRAAGAGAPIAGFPLRRVVAGCNFVADVTFGAGEVLFDYKREARRPISSVLEQFAAQLAPSLQGAA